MQARLRLPVSLYPLWTIFSIIRRRIYVTFSVSENGLLLYQNRSAAGVSQLAWYDRIGKEISSLGSPANQANPEISPDGKRVGVDITDSLTGNTDVWIYESSGGIPTRFTSGQGEETRPIWSPDGR